jgi:hypothetical protein
MGKLIISLFAVVAVAAGPQAWGCRSTTGPKCSRTL